MHAMRTSAASTGAVVNARSKSRQQPQCKSHEMKKQRGTHGSSFCSSTNTTVADSVSPSTGHASAFSSASILRTDQHQSSRQAATRHEQQAGVQRCRFDLVSRDLVLGEPASGSGLALVLVLGLGFGVIGAASSDHDRKLIERGNNQPNRKSEPAKPATQWEVAQSTRNLPAA